MYICNNCGKETETQPKFCTQCGTKFEAVPSVVDENAVPKTEELTEAVKETTPKEEKPKKKKKTGLSIAIICIAVLVLAGLGVGGYLIYDNFIKDKRPSFMLTLDCSPGGTITTESKEYKEGTKIDLIAEPETGYVFGKWVRSDGEPVENEDSATAQIVMPSSELTVSALFITEQQANLTEDDIFAYKVYNSLRIEYTEGDYADSVTRKLHLNTRVNEDKETAEISWTSSNMDVIDDGGNITRPTDENIKVVLTATIQVGDADPLTKEFEVTVIATSLFSINDSDNYSILEIEQMNSTDNPVEISYTDDMEYVETISGKYSEIVVNSEEAALRALCNVRGLLGIDNPIQTLKWKATNYDDDSLIYSFAQYYEDYRVYGYSVIVSADRTSGEVNYLNSSLKPDTLLSKTNTTIAYTEDSLKSDFSDVDTSSYEIVVYAYGDYESNPELAYYVTSEAETILVSAYDGTVLMRYSNDYDWGDCSTTGTGEDELGNTQTFPVQFHQWDWWFYYLEDVERGIYIKGDNASAITHEFNSTWNDSTAISAYINSIEVYDWLKEHLNRDSIDNRGMDYIVNVHASGNSDNACWKPSTNQMYFFDNADTNGGNPPTTASGLDILAHETTHGMLQFILAGNGVTDFPYENYTGAINEGYADVFGWLVDHSNTTMGENWKVIRDVATPSKYGAPEVLSDYINNGNQSYMVHKNSSLVYHAAYLMEKNGITGSDLEKLWYKSLYLGYNVKSNFYSVRKNLIQAGKNLNFSDEKMAAIRKAFDEEKIYAELGDLFITFKDVNGNQISVSDLEGLAIKTEGLEKCYPDNTYTNGSLSGNVCYYESIYKGKYKVTISAEGYLPLIAEVDVLERNTNALQVVLTKDGDVDPVKGYITSATTGLPMSDVNVTVLQGWNVKSSEAVASGKTNTEGYYEFDLNAGYYTLVLEKDEYTTGYMNIIASPEYNDIYQNGSISPIIGKVDSYRVVLSWGEYPSDLDAHLKGYVDDDMKFHVYYRNNNGYYNDKHYANLDVDDTTSYGPETVTFAVDTNLDYEYFIDWYTGSGTWANCYGKVEVYSGSNLLYVFNAPAQDNKSGSWLVFTIKNGIFRVQDKIVEDMY